MNEKICWIAACWGGLGGTGMPGLACVRIPDLCGAHTLPRGQHRKVSGKQRNGENVWQAASSQATRASGRPRVCVITDLEVFPSEIHIAVLNHERCMCARKIDPRIRFKTNT